MLTIACDALGATVAKQRHLARAPITEALIDLRVVARDGFAFADLKSAFEPPDFGYYMKSSITEGLFELKLPPDGQAPETSAQSEQTGLRLHSGDERYVAQCGVSGFTLSRLQPYEDWGALLDETQRIWSSYVQRAKPKRVRRLATRFINNLRLPLADGEPIESYLNKLVDLPEEVPQLVEGFFQRFRIVDAGSGARIVLTLALDGRAPPGPVPVILDVEARMEADLDPADPDLWKTLEHLRELKNQSFFGVLTERAVRLYE